MPIHLGSGPATPIVRMVHFVCSNMVLQGLNLTLEESNREPREMGRFVAGDLSSDNVGHFLEVAAESATPMDSQANR